MKPTAFASLHLPTSVRRLLIVLLGILLAFTSAIGMPTPASAGNLQPDVKLSILPATTSVRPGDQFTALIHLDMPSATAPAPSPHLISIATMKVQYDPAVVQAIDFRPCGSSNPDCPQRPHWQVLQGPVIDNSAGTAAIAQTIGFDTTQALQSAANIASITFRALGADHWMTPLSWLRAEALSLSENDGYAENVVGVAYGAMTCVDSAVSLCKRLQPAMSIPLGQLGTNSVNVKLGWGATDGDGTAGYSLEQSVNGTTFSPVSLSTPTTTSVTRPLINGESYQFRASHTDALGNTSIPAVGPSWAPEQGRDIPSKAFHVALHDDSDQAAAYAPDWSYAALRGSYGGGVRFASTAGAKMQFAVRNTEISQSTGVSQAQSIALTSTKGPNRGKAEIWHNGVKAAAVDLYSSRLQTRQIVFSRNLNASRDHVLEVRVLGTKRPTSSGTRVDTDAIVVLR